MRRLLAIAMGFAAALLFMPSPAAAGDAVPPPVTAGQPGPGCRVRVTPPEYPGTDVHHTLFLPADWSEPRRNAGGRWLESSGLPLAGVTYLDVRIATIFTSLPHEIAPGLEVINGHTDRWVLVDSPDTDTARAWVKGLLAPGEERTDRPAAVP